VEEIGMSNSTSQVPVAISELRRSLGAENPEFAKASESDQNANALCQAIRSNLRQERLNLEIDQAVLADSLDMSQSAISKFETGKGDIGFKSLFRIADGLGLVPLVIFARKEGLSSVRERPSALFDVLASAQEQLFRQMRPLILR
jgi:transcriptional regulator with XRE-family HTH domain